ncbi:hypothetical protein [Arthrobacter sp. G119Y2]|uniref:hypothetical protein n=1 Tax=Arthrobacter sp. G119Y2 TaxID=3134965 RepID=UPI003119275B
MATFIRTPGVNPDTSRPSALSIDPVAAQTGALMLVDPTNPIFGKGFTGVPAHGATVPNLAWLSAAAAVGGTQASLAAVVDTVGMAGAKGALERTAKGGIHAIFSQVNNTAAADRTHYSLIVPEPIRTYLDANPDHNIYLSIWGRNTRRTDAASGQVVSISGIDAGTTAYRAYLNDNGSTAPSTGGSFLGARGSGATPLGNYIKNVGAAGTTGAFSIGTSTPTERARLWGIGNTGFLNTYAGGAQPAPQGHSGSHILYRAYLEDLTLSGRTYAQVDALDSAYYTEEVLTPGGRYYGDTFTAPV